MRIDDSTTVAVEYFVREVERSEAVGHRAFDEAASDLGVLASSFLKQDFYFQLFPLVSSKNSRLFSNEIEETLTTTWLTPSH